MGLPGVRSVSEATDCMEQPHSATPRKGCKAHDRPAQSVSPRPRLVSRPCRLRPASVVERLGLDRTVQRTPVPGGTGPTPGGTAVGASVPGRRSATRTSGRLWPCRWCPLILLMFWNPVFRLRTVGARQVQIIDPASIFTAPYFLLVATGFVAYGVSALLAYLDWDRLRKDGVVRPFHWAWVFLSRELYVIGRSVIVHEVAPRRGLAPVWATIGVTPAHRGAHRPQDVRHRGHPGEPGRDD